MTRLDELRAKKAEIEAEIAAIESTPAWEPTPGEIVEMSNNPDYEWVTRRYAGSKVLFSGKKVYFDPHGWERDMIRPLDWSTVPDAGLPKAHPSAIYYRGDDTPEQYKWSFPEGGVYPTKERALEVANWLIVRLVRGIK